jgi:sialic acid synthase SpsE
MADVRIGERLVGKGHPVFVLAEAGINHNGSVDLARRLIDVAADAGCDAVKFQKRTVRALLSREAYERPYTNGGHSYGRTYGEHRERLELSEAQHTLLSNHARNRGIIYLASSWDHGSADFVDSLQVPAHKIGSPDLTNMPLCAHVAGFGKPVILSTGMSDPTEVGAAVRHIQKINDQLILLHCVSIYPTPPEDVRLGRMAVLRKRYDVPVGYSGHEMGWHAVIAAVTLGACLVEKHITLDRTMPGGDHVFSLEPKELHQMVVEIRETEAMLSRQDKPLLDAEIPYRLKLAKSVTTRISVSKGTMITADMLVCKSPATGVSPYQIDDLIGCRAKRDLEANAVIHREDIAL